MTARYAKATTATAGQALVLLLMAALVLAPSLLGRAGYQAIEQAVAARIFPLHTHGVPGERHYIAEHGTWVGYVHDHCHRATNAVDVETPAQIALGGLLFGPLLCGAGATSPAEPAAQFALDQPRQASPTGVSVPPTTPPPQA